MNISNPGRRWIRVGIAGGALAAAALIGVVAQAQPGGMRGMHGGPMWFGGSPEHAARAIDHMLDGLNATEAQRTQVKQIAQGLATDMKPQREAGKALRDKATALLTAPNVDANAAEQLRQQMLTQHDQMSRRVMTAMLDVSRVLTPEQRAKVAERLKQREEKMRERHERHERTERGQPKS